MDAFSAMSCDLAYALALEQLLCIEVPPRAQWLRTIYGELGRLASHLYWCAQCAATPSGPPFAAPAYAWEGRIAILELFQQLGGNPLMPDVIAIGGLHRDTPSRFADALTHLVGQLETLLDDLESLISSHAGFRADMKHTGIIDPGTALGLGMTGPCLRASGIGYDVRRAFPYAAYGSLEMTVPTHHGCDADARYAVRMAEIRSSIDIIRQAQRHLEPGPVNALPAGDALPPLPTSMAYASVEGPRGELGVLAVAAGQPRLAHVYVRAPSFANLSALRFVTYGRNIERFAVVLDSLDISMGEVER
jgi:NADH-quinone oxidoreductase subunit D